MWSTSSLICISPLLLTNVVAFNSNIYNPLKSNRRSLLNAAAISSADLDLLPEIREAVMDAGGAEEWEESAKVLSELFESSEEESELVLADAFRWKAWAMASGMMRRYQKPVLPEKDKVIEALGWLKDGPLELTDGQIRSNILSHPQIYLVEPDKAYKKVLGSAPRKYRDATTLKFLIEDDPTILQVWYNCDEEGCQSECGSCWVAYENRLPSVPDF